MMRNSPLKRRSQVRAPMKEKPRREFPSHRAWVRKFVCAAHASGECQGKIEAAHLRSGVPASESGGTGLKPHDKWIWPACEFHHQLQHRIGEASFQARYGLDLRKLCEMLQATSPHKKQWEADV